VYPQELLEFLKLLEVDCTTVRHQQVQTIEESRKMRGHIPGVHTKNLFLRDAKKRFFLLVTEETTAIDLKIIGSKIGATGKLSFATAADLLGVLSVVPGAVSLLALVNDTDKKTTLVLDPALLKSSLVNCHPLSNEFTTSLSPEGILTFLSAIGLEPVLIPFHDRDRPASDH
jgi:Ala-tRNA(Pro) deacylase